MKLVVAMVACVTLLASGVGAGDDLCSRLLKMCTPVEERTDCIEPASVTLHVKGMLKSRSGAT